MSRTLPDFANRSGLQAQEGKSVVGTEGKTQYSPFRLWINRDAVDSCELLSDPNRSWAAGQPPPDMAVLTSTVYNRSFRDEEDPVRSISTNLGLESADGAADYM